MVYKRCTETGCEKAPRCKHEWYLQVVVAGDRERGPVAKYVRLLRLDLDRMPQTKAEAEVVESKVHLWMVAGRPPVLPPPSPDTPPPSSGRTLRSALETYERVHVAKMSDKGAPSIVKRLKRDLGDADVTILLDRIALREWLAEVLDESSAVNYNRHLSRWSHALSFCRAEYRLDGPSPFFHRTQNPLGIAKLNEGDGRTRRLKTKPVDEEAALFAGAATLDDGGIMVARLACAIDAGLRRGEMLAMRREDVLRGHGGFKGYTLRVGWMTAKTKRTRYVPVTSTRLAAWLTARMKNFSLEFVFGQVDGTRVGVDAFRIDWERTLLASKLAAGRYLPRAEGAAHGAWEWTTDPDLHWHDLRHECGSRLAASGVSLPDIRELLGHRTLATTQKYLNPTFSGMAARMKAAHKAIGV